MGVIGKVPVLLKYPLKVFFYIVSPCPLIFHVLRKITHSRTQWISWHPNGQGNIGFLTCFSCHITALCPGPSLTTAGTSSVSQPSVPLIDSMADMPVTFPFQIQHVLLNARKPTTCHTLQNWNVFSSVLWVATWTPGWPHYLMLCLIWSHFKNLDFASPPSGCI